MRWERLNNILQGRRRRIDEFLQCRLCTAGMYVAQSQACFCAGLCHGLCLLVSCLHASFSPLIMFSDISKAEVKDHIFPFYRRPWGGVAQWSGKADQMIKTLRRPKIQQKWFVNVCISDTARISIHRNRADHGVLIYTDPVPYPSVKNDMRGMILRWSVLV